MTNQMGLWVDGFHVSDWRGNGTECDERNEMVYTYNQGVLLSAQRQLWEAAGETRYLDDGYALIGNVIAATGFDDIIDGAESQNSGTDGSSKWRGLGMRGVMMDYCDPRGDCSQDGQTFKGIFFLHFTAFCTPLPLADPNHESLRAGPISHRATPEEAASHAAKCKSYIPWIELNAKAALRSRDENGLFGMWWRPDTASTSTSTSLDASEVANGEEMDITLLPAGASDIRNMASELELRRMGGLRRSQTVMPAAPIMDGRDPNERGRGRTVETQGGGVMILRALHELRSRFGD